MDQTLSQSKNLKEFFYKKVRGALELQKMSISQEAEFYVVNVLEHFSKSENLFHINDQGKLECRPLALKLYDATFSAHHGERFAHLKSLGDTALYHAGVFYDGLYNQIVDVNYYIQMGGTAYRSLANISTPLGKTLSEMFHELSERFHNLVEVLYICCEQEIAQTNHDLLKMLDRYLKTGSIKAKQILEEKGILPDAIVVDKTVQ